MGQVKAMQKICQEGTLINGHTSFHGHIVDILSSDPTGTVVVRLEVNVQGSPGIATDVEGKLPPSRVIFGQGKHQSAQHTVITVQEQHVLGIRGQG